MLIQLRGVDIYQHTGRLAHYAVAATLARTADEMVGLSVVLFVLDRTDSAALAGAAVAGYTLPAVLTGPLLGAWLASAGKRATLALAGNELVLAVVAVALVLTVGHVPAAVVVVLTAFAGVSLPLTSAGYSSLLPAMVGRAALAKANTVDAMSVNGPAIAGPAVAGTLAAAFSPTVSILAVAVVAVVAAVVTLPMRVTPRDADIDRPALLRVAKAGLAHLASTPPLRAATLASVVSYGCVGLLVVALPARVVQLGVGPQMPATCGPRSRSAACWASCWSAPGCGPRGRNGWCSRPSGRTGYCWVCWPSCRTWQPRSPSRWRPGSRRGRACRRCSPHGSATPPITCWPRSPPPARA